MNVKEAIEKRRSFRSLAPFKVTEEIINELGTAAQLAPSCYNKQPGQYVFVYEPQMLKAMQTALSQGNEWAYEGSLIIAILGKKEDDCVIKDRFYHHFDIGMASAQMTLRAVEMGLIVHPIAGYSPSKTRRILQIPSDVEVIALFIVGKQANEINPQLNEQQKEVELQRPSRKPLSDFIFHNSYQQN